MPLNLVYCDWGLSVIHYLPRKMMIEYVPNCKDWVSRTHVTFCISTITYNYVFFHIEMGLSDDTKRILKYNISKSAHLVLGLHQHSSKDFCKEGNGEAPGELPNVVLL